MSLGRETTQPRGSGAHEPESKPSRDNKVNWLFAGIVCVIIAIADIVFYAKTGAILFRPRTSPNNSIPGGLYVLLNVLTFMFGIVALIIHFSRPRK